MDLDDTYEELKHIFVNRFLETCFYLDDTYEELKLCF